MRVGRDFVGVDLYGMLDVTAEASVDEIRRAYRRRARESHPDRCPDDDGAVSRMRDINLAARVLLDPALRAVYDRARRAQGAPAASGWWERVSADDRCDWEPSPAPAAPRVPVRLRGFARGLRGTVARSLLQFDGWVLSFPPRGRLAIGSLGIGLALILLAFARPRFPGPMGGDRPQPVSISPAALYP